MLQSPFKQYLKLSKRWYELQKLNKFKDVKNINIVIGNESADLDSNIGSMIYAYYKFCKTQKTQYDVIKQSYGIEEKTIENLIDVFVPVIQCDKQDITSRFETIDLFETHNIDVNDIIFKDELNLNEINETIKLNLILYDHNCTTYPNLKNNVVDILDHHKDNTLQFYSNDQLISKNIQTIGSATTLLGEYFMQQENQHLLDIVISYSIINTIIVDCYNFDPKQETIRWNNRDLNVYQYLANYINKNQNDNVIDKNQIFSYIEGLKFDCKKNLGLGMMKLLGKDYKQNVYCNNTQVGYSVFMIPPESIFETFKTDEIEKNIQEYIKLKNIDILFLLFAYPTKEYFERKIIVLTRNEERIHDLKTIEDILKSKLKISDIDFKQYWNVYKNMHFSFYDTTHSYTRKIIEPIVAEIPFSKL